MQFQKPSRPISAHMARAKGGESTAIDPKGPKRYFLGEGQMQLRKASRPISIGKAKPKGNEKIAIEPRGAKW